MVVTINVELNKPPRIVGFNVKFAPRSRDHEPILKENYIIHFLRLIFRLNYTLSDVVRLEIEYNILTHQIRGAD